MFDISPDNIKIPLTRTCSTIRDSTVPFHYLISYHGILEVRKLLTPGTDRYIVVYDYWHMDNYVIPFGEGIIVNNKFRWICKPQDQYSAISSDVLETAERIAKTIEWFINKDS